MNYQSKSLKESIPDWMDEVVKELGEKFGLKLQLKTNLQK
jgi:hypothetical protein